MNFQKFKLDLEKAEEPAIKLPTFVGSSKKQEFQKNIYFCFIDYVKAFAEKAMAPHSSTLGWKIPWTEEPGRLRSMGSLRVGHD